jgi:hypothetical protein
VCLDEGVYCGNICGENECWYKGSISVSHTTFCLSSHYALMKADGVTCKRQKEYEHSPIGGSITGTIKCIADFGRQ